MTWEAPARTDPVTAAHPTPPHPKTATESPGPTSPVNMAAPRPAITPQPSSPAASGRARGSTLVHWPAATRVFSAKAPMPRAGESMVPSGSVIFCVALWVEKQYQGRPRRHDRHSTAHRPPVEDDEVPRRHRRDVGAHRLHDAGGLVAEQEGEVVVDAPFPVVEVGVAHAAGLHAHERFARAGVGHEHGLERDRRALGQGDDAAHLVCHRVPPPSP